jgi:hypothetical protein
LEVLFEKLIEGRFSKDIIETANKEERNTVYAGD